MRSIRLAIVIALLGSASPAAAKPILVRAAPVRGGDVQSPRRLFNTGLSEEEGGNFTRAVQYYLSARLSLRHSFADELYARGAGYRLVRILAGYDDDAAAAAAMLVSVEADATLSSDLAPLIRSLLNRDLERTKGVISSIRFRPRDHQSVIELEVEGEEEKRLILADGVVGPFSAGDQVRILIRKDRKHAFAGWRLIAIGHADADGWQMLAVTGLPGEAGEAYGALLRQ
jgi:hypothetical protein